MVELVSHSRDKRDVSITKLKAANGRAVKESIEGTGHLSQAVIACKRIWDLCGILVLSFGDGTEP